MPYTRHLATLEIAVHSPFMERRHRRPAMITRRQYRLVAAVLSGYAGSQRELAARTGYTLAGLNDAVASMRRLGILAVSVTRGRYGRTRLSLVRGVHVMRSNVRHRGGAMIESLSTVTSSLVTTMPDIRTLLHLTRPEPAGGAG